MNSKVWGLGNWITATPLTKNENTGRWGEVQI